MHENARRYGQCDIETGPKPTAIVTFWLVRRLSISTFRQTQKRATQVATTRGESMVRTRSWVSRTAGMLTLSAAMLFVLSICLGVL